MTTTNILATIAISVITNVVETLPQIEVSGPPSIAPDGSIYAVYNFVLKPDPNPKEKWITTNIVEVTTVRFTHAGTPFEAKSERMLTNWSTHFTLKPTEWIPNTNLFEFKKKP